MIELTARETKRYSIRNAIMVDVARRMGDRRANSFELEISAQLQRDLGAGYEHQGGILVPTNITLDHTRAGLDTKTPSKGQELTFDEFGTFIDLLRPQSWVIELGATVLSGLKGDVGFPRATAGAVVTWQVENPGTDVAESDLALDTVWLTPRTAQSTTMFSRQLLAQSTPSVDKIVATDLAKAHAAALDRAALQGVAPAPVGLYNQLIQTADFGAAFNYSGAVHMEFLLNQANANGNPMTLAYLADPQWAMDYKITPIAATIGMPAWSEGKVNGIRAEVSKNMPAPGCILGNWPEVLIGDWGVLEIITDPYAKKKQGMVEVTSFVLTDVEFRHLQSFVKAGNFGTLPAMAAAEASATKGKK